MNARQKWVTIALASMMLLLLFAGVSAVIVVSRARFRAAKRGNAVEGSARRESIAPCISEEAFWLKNGALIGAPNLVELRKTAEVLGRGGFGEVLTCGDRASMVLKISTEQDVTTRATFVHEMASYDTIGNNPYFPKAYGCFVGNSSAGLLLERLGPSLDTLRDAPRSPRAGQNLPTSPSRVPRPTKSWVRSRTEAQRAGIYRSLALVYDYAHQKGVCNNDVKPNNIVQSLNAGSRFKAIDFGVSCRMGDACGTYSYPFKAPEAYNELKISNGKFRGYPGADVWALLLTIYYMETDVRGFDFALELSKCDSMNNGACKDTLISALRARPNVSRLALIAVDIMARPYEERNSMQVIAREMEKVIGPSPQVRPLPRAPPLPHVHRLPQVHRLQ